MTDDTAQGAFAQRLDAVDRLEREHALLEVGRE